MFEKDFTEVYEVIQHMEDKDLKMIPNSFLKLIQDNMDSDYNFEYDESKKLNDQNLSEDSRLIITFMYLRYLAPDEEKKLLYEKILEDKKRSEKRFLSNDELFEKRVSDNVENEPNSKLEISVVNEKSKWYKRLFEKLKGIFNFFKN